MILEIGDRRLFIKGGSKNPNYLLFCSDREPEEITGRLYDSEDYRNNISSPKLTDKDRQNSEVILRHLKEKQAQGALPPPADWSYLFPPAMR